MTDNPQSTSKDKGKKGRRKNLILSLGILMAGSIIVLIIFLTEPAAKREGATRTTAMLVETIEVHRDTFQPLIVATGTVVPYEDIVLSPRISGEVISRSDAFTPGGFVQKGEVLLQIDPSDYENAVQLRQSELQQAMADLNIEMGRQDVAEKDYQLVDGELSSENKSLVLRQPQLNAVKSRVKAAEASLNQAKLELERTRIIAPFDAHILSRNVNLGSQVSPGDHLGRLVGRDQYWVELTIPLSKLPWLTFPEKAEEKGAEVQLRNRAAWPEGVYRTGYLYQLIGTLEERTRLAKILVTVSDPLALKGNSEERPPLMIGAFMEASIEGKEIPNVIRLNRDYVRKNQTVWVMQDQKLEIREVKIMLQDRRYAYISEGLKEGDKIVTTNLTTVAPGVGLRTEEDTANTMVNQQMSIE